MSVYLPFPIPRKTTHRKLFLLTKNEHVTVSGECHWQMGTSNWGQSVAALSSAKTEISLGEYYTTELSHYNCYTSGVNETPITALGAQEPQESQTTCSSTAPQSQPSGTI
jgi:hypothetical protein